VPKIKLELDRFESYALLVATECLRQLFCEEDGGIPLVAELRPGASNREYTELGVTFTSLDDVRYLRVRVHAGDHWPKEGRVFLKADEPNLNDLHYDFRLEGHPANPEVHFTRLASGRSN
jgi:hypothetical protein